MSSVRPLSALVREPNGPAWRVLSITVDGIERWYGDPPYPACRGNCWIDLEIECPYDHPPTEEKPVALRGAILCEPSDLPVSAGDTQRDREWTANFRKPQEAKKLPDGEGVPTVRGDAAPLPPVPAWEDATWINEPRCRICAGVMQENADHVNGCHKNCFGTFIHEKLLAKSCALAELPCNHGGVIYVPRRENKGENKDA